MKTSVWLLLSLLVCQISGFQTPVFGSASGVEHFKFESSAGSSEFLATGRPGSFKIKGKGAGVSGVVDVEGTHVTGTLSLDLSSFDTGMKMRNDHMKTKYLQLEKFPNTTLKVDSAAFIKTPLAKGQQIDHGSFDGKLTLHGVTKDVNGNFDAKFDGTKLDVTADFTVDITDFGIEKPKFSGISVDEKVQVHLTSVANLNQ